MIDRKIIREEPKRVEEAAKKRHVKVPVKKILELDERARATAKELEESRAALNSASKAISALKGKDKETAIEKTRTTKQRIKDLEAESNQLEEELSALMYAIPNIPFDTVPVGKSEEDNVVVRTVGEKPSFSFTPKEYVALAEACDLIDTDRAARLAGSRFGYIKNELAILEWGIVLLTLQRLSNAAWVKHVADDAKLDVLPHTFTPMVPPVMIRPEMFRAMGKLDPGQEEERYFVQKDNLYLIGSAEHALGPYYADEILPAESLPRRFIGFSTCFRREAGSYGKDTKGILRVHQFDKLEMFSFAKPETSQQEHRLFVACQEALMKELALPYQLVAVCTGDMVWTDAEQFDINTWLPGQQNGKGEYRETHSTSNSTDFQSRRLHTRYKAKDGTTGLVHTINGTAFAIGRTLIAIMENFQQEDGSIRVPAALQPYCGFAVIKPH